MGRLPKGRKEHRKNWIAGLIRLCGLGLSEDEISQETGIDRRTVNNYLREIDQEEEAHKEGNWWFPD